MILVNIVNLVKGLYITSYSQTYHTNVLNPFCTFYL